MANVSFFQAKTVRGQILQFFQGRQEKMKNTEISRSLTNYLTIENEPDSLQSQVICQISAFLRYSNCCIRLF